MERKTTKKKEQEQPIDVAPRVADEGMNDWLDGKYETHEESAALDSGSLDKDDRPDLENPVDATPLTNLLGEYLKTETNGLDKNQRLIGRTVTNFNGKIDSTGKINAKIDQRRKFNSGLFW